MHFYIRYFKTRQLFVCVWNGRIYLYENIHFNFKHFPLGIGIHSLGFQACICVSSIMRTSVLKPFGAQRMITMKKSAIQNYHRKDTIRIRETEDFFPMKMVFSSVVYLCPLPAIEAIYKVSQYSFTKYYTWYLYT